MKILISDLDNTLFDATSLSGEDALAGLRHIRPFDGAEEVLSLPDFKNFLVSAGDPNVQSIKLGVLKLGGFFHGIYVCGAEADKAFVYDQILATHGRGASRESVFVLGTPGSEDVRTGNSLGFKTVCVGASAPRDARDMPTHAVSSLREAAAVLGRA